MNGWKVRAFRRDVFHLRIDLQNLKRTRALRARIDATHDERAVSLFIPFVILVAILIVITGPILFSQRRRLRDQRLVARPRGGARPHPVHHSQQIVILRVRVRRQHTRQSSSLHALVIVVVVVAREVRNTSRLPFALFFFFKFTTPRHAPLPSVHVPPHRRTEVRTPSRTPSPTLRRGHRRRRRPHPRAPARSVSSSAFPTESRTRERPHRTGRSTSFTCITN